MKNKYVPLDQRKVLLSFWEGSRVLEIPKQAVTDELLTAIKQILPDAVCSVRLTLGEAVWVLGDVSAAAIHKGICVADDEDASHNLLSFIKALFAGIHPLAALKMIELDCSGDGYVCPNCGDMHHIEVCYESNGLIVQTEDGEVTGLEDSKTSGDKTYGETSSAQCTACSFSGSLAEFDGGESTTMIKTRVASQQHYAGKYAGAEVTETA